MARKYLNVEIRNENDELLLSKFDDAIKQVNETNNTKLNRSDVVRMLMKNYINKNIKKAKTAVSPTPSKKTKHKIKEAKEENKQEEIKQKVIFNDWNDIESYIEEKKLLYGFDTWLYQAIRQNIISKKMNSYSDLDEQGINDLYTYWTSNKR